MTLIYSWLKGTRILHIVLYVLFTPTLFAQGIKGIVRDENDSIIPFATVIVDDLKTGTSANSLGVYQMSLEKGSYVVRFEALGYSGCKHLIQVTDSFQTLDVVLKSKSYALTEVVVENGEDPAYPIMRKVIALAPFHLNQVKSYLAQIYLRGTLEIINIPWILKGKIKINDIAVKSGDVFSEESMNEIKFLAPDLYEHKVISFKTTFPDRQGDPLPNLKESFYQSEMGGLLSPLSPKAFSFYKFEYKGFSTENGVNVCKIQVIPKKQSTQLYSGFIYIVEDCWALHSLELTNENTYGSFTIREVMSPVMDDAWLPINYHMRFGGSLMGLSGQFTYNGAVTYKQVEMNRSLIRPSLLKPLNVKGDTVLLAETKPKFKNSKNQRVFEELQSKEKLSNRDMIRLARICADEAKSEEKVNDLEVVEKTKYSVDKDAEKRDTLYWKTVRPIPLTKVETKVLDPVAFEKLDTTAKSAPKPPNKYLKAIGNVFFGREVKFLADSSLKISYGGLLGLRQLDYNTVDGFVWGQRFSAQWAVDSVHRLTFEPTASYAFSRKSLMWNVKANYSYAPLKNGLVEFRAAHSSTDFNRENGIRRFVNAGYTLLVKENYMKLYDNRYYSVSNKIDFINGLESYVDIAYSKEYNLENTTDFSFFYKDSRTFTSNTPINVDYSPLPQNGFASFVAEVKFSYTPFMHYRIHKGVKENLYSNFPTVSLSYKKGFKEIVSSQCDFDKVEASLNQTITFLGMSALTYDVRGALFLNNRSLPFSQFSHFNTQNIPINLGSLEQSFYLLDYYTSSTNRYFLEAHTKYETPYLLFKLLPFFDKQIWTESLHIDYLTNDSIKNYCQIGYGMNHLFLVTNFGVFAGFEKGKYTNWGIRALVSF